MQDVQHPGLLSGTFCTETRVGIAELKQRCSGQGKLLPHNVGCTCDLRHAVQTVTVNDRWALLILARGDLAPTAPSVILSSIPPMADLLPLNRMRGKGGSRGGEGPAPAELGIPLWWLRRDQR